MEEPSVLPQTKTTDGTHSSTNPPSNDATAATPPTSQVPLRTDRDADPNTADRSGLAVRLVRKTRTNFLLPGSKKSRKSKTTILPDGACSPTVPSKDAVHRHSVTSSSGQTPANTVDRKRDKHAKSRENPVAGKSRGETSSKSRSSLRKKSKRKLKGSAGSDSYSAQNQAPPSKPVFGVRLSVACERSPSHDGVPLPAFFRHCIDYVEQNGLSSEGIYRVPGVNSQIQSLVSALDKGEDFLQIPPTSPAYYQFLETMKHPTSSRAAHSFDTASKAKSQFHTGHSDHSTRGSAPSPKRNRSGTVDIRPTPISVQPQLPHDLAVICSVIKYFLRNLPEPVLTTSLGTLMESVPTENRTMYEALARLVHQQLPRSHRYILAWLLQHMAHIIDRAGENLMTQANIIIVLSPCLGISHRLLSILLGPAPPDVNIDLTQLDPSLPPADPKNDGSDPSTWHWLFRHPVYLLRPYHPPLRPGPDLELPETNEELDLELRKQESLLYHLHEQIGRGETSAEKEAFLWEVQRLVTEIRRRKQLVDPDAIRAELSRQQAQLDRLHRAIALNAVDPSLDSTGLTSHTDGSQPANTAPGSDSSSSHRRRLIGSAKPRTEPVSLYSDELWEVQRQVTMLKRRLKQQEKLASSSQTGGTANVATGQFVSRPDAIVQPVGGVPLIIPSLSELDEEEVLNLTLRKLPLDAVPADTTSETVFSVPPGPETTFCATTLNSTMGDTPHLEESERKAQDPPEVTSKSPIELDISGIPVSNEGIVKPPDSTVAQASPPPSPCIVESVDKVDSDTVQFSANPDQLILTDLQETHVISTSKSGQPSDENNVPLEANTSPIAAHPHSTSPDGCPQAPSVLQHQTQPVKLEPAARNYLYQIAMYEARKHELNAIQADLRARIRSEQAEIRQIQSRINYLLETGGTRVRRLYEAQFAPADRGLATSTVDSSGLHSSGSLGQSSVWLTRSWTRIANMLNSDTCHLSDEREACLMDNDSDGSDVSSSDHSASGPTVRRSFDHSVTTGATAVPTGSQAATPVSYVRLLDHDEDEGCGQDHVGGDTDQKKITDQSSDVTSCAKVVNGVATQKVSVLPGEFVTGEDVDVNDGHLDEEEEEDEDEEEGEVELARTLHQLTLDNARLVQLNARYLEGIQAERNRCAELKVLLKLRNIRSISAPFHLRETFAPV